MASETPSVDTIFCAAIAIASAEQRAAYIAQACGDDPDLRARVEKLVAAHLQAGSFLKDPAGGPSSPQLDAAPGGREIATIDEPAVTERPGTVIGPYKLMEQIGEGGMGLVFVAEQHQPVRRKVALKVIKPGMDTRQVIARFEAERQALALMDHPNIAKVLDAGTTGSGRPFFVMELVKGIPITQFCDESRLTTGQRLELFVPVCQAVQHAHHKGIIHRDLKPSNVMVISHDGTPVIKVIDFGVAKAVGLQLTDKTIYTQFTQLVGTPLYMSPEQAGQSGLDVDTRTDIYALGVLLYELLTGTTPFKKERFHEAAHEEMRRIIREEEPPKPSTRISTLVGQAATTFSTQRKSDPKRLSQLFRGELDWIVMKCLEKDRNRRYETANALAADVQRYLHDEPVQACPPSAAYWLRKFARKYRTLLRAAAAFVVLLVLAAAVSTWQAVRATLAEGQALKDRDRAEASFRMARAAVDRFFTQVSQSPKLKAHGMEKFRRELLQSAKGFYEGFIQEQFDAPGVRSDLGLAYQRLGEIDRELGDYAAAEESLNQAVAILGELARGQPEVAEYPRDLAASYVALGLVYYNTARWEKAAAAYQQALDIQEKQAGAYPQAAEYRYVLAKTYSALGLVLYRADRRESAATMSQQAQDILSKLVDDFPGVSEYQALLAATQMNLGQVYLIQGWDERAEMALKETQRIYEGLARGRQDVPAEYWQSLARSHALIGMVYKDRVQFQKAEAAQQEALQIFEKLANEHGDVQEYVYDVGRCYFELARTADRGGRPDAALDRYDKAIEIMESAKGKGYLAARFMLLGARIDRNAPLAGRGDHAQAADNAESLARQEDLNSSHIYDVACVFSRASAAADRDTKLSTADRTRLKAHYADRAMDFLRQAVAKGWRNPRVMNKDPDLDPLRTRVEFQKLLADLERETKE